MKWIDYREKLGIGFNDEMKFKMLTNMIQNFINNIVGDAYSERAYFNYCMMIGESYYDYNRPYQHLSSNMGYCKTISEILSKFIAFYNTYEFSYDEYSYSRPTTKKEVFDFLKNSLNDIRIPFEIYKDNDGIFVFPTGAKELDDALVSDLLDWLKEYPQAYKTYCTALKQYTDKIYVRDVADNLRKALEDFLKEFLDNTKNLENNKTEICKYLGAQGVDAGVIGLFQPLINSYKNINDRIAKHNDAVDEKLLEFLLYQTGVLIRMVLSVKKLDSD